MGFLAKRNFRHDLLRNKIDIIHSDLSVQMYLCMRDLNVMDIMDTWVRLV